MKMRTHRRLAARANSRGRTWAMDYESVVCTGGQTYAWPLKPYQVAFLRSLSPTARVIDAVAVADRLRDKALDQLQTLNRRPWKRKCTWPLDVVTVTKSSAVGKSESLDFAKIELRVASAVGKSEAMAANLQQVETDERGVRSVEPVVRGTLEVYFEDKEFFTDLERSPLGKPWPHS